jgi:hypothetical protein
MRPGDSLLNSLAREQISMVSSEFHVPGIREISKMNLGLYFMHDGRPAPQD